MKIISLDGDGGIWSGGYKDVKKIKFEMGNDISTQGY